MKYCFKCGAEIKTATNFCTSCGNPLNSEAEPATLDIEENVNEIPDIKENINEVHAQNSALKEDSDKRDVKPVKKIMSGVIPKIVLGFLIILAVVCGIFSKQIRGEYYLIKCSSSHLDSEKLDYSIEALKLLKNSKTTENFKNIVENMPSEEISLAEEKLTEIEPFLTKKDYQTLAISVKDKKINYLYTSQKYDEIPKMFQELDNLGGNIRDNKNYENIMLNIVSMVTNTQPVSNKNLLMKNQNICFDNLDQDAFDEIVKFDASSYNETGVSLYKIKDGQYKLVDQLRLSTGYNEKIMGIYKYAKDVNGIFINYQNYATASTTAVIGVINDTISLKGAVSSNNFTEPDDANKDGIYEIRSNNKSNIINQEDDQWYKINEDGSTPVKITAGSSAAPSVSSTIATQASASNDSSSSEYIFKDSDSRKLTDEDLKKLSKKQLALARNEIFARHGYVFKDPSFIQYFESKSWYKAAPGYNGSDSALNEIEIANYKLIQVWEKK